MGDRYVYDRVSFKVVNNDKFLEKIKRMEAESKGDKPKLEGIKFPFLLVFFTVFIWYQWETIPYKVVYKHATINENIFNKNYYHAVFTSKISHDRYIFDFFPSFISKFLTQFISFFQIIRLFSEKSFLKVLSFIIN